MDGRLTACRSHPRAVELPCELAVDGFDDLAGVVEQTVHWRGDLALLVASEKGEQAETAFLPRL